MVAKVEFPFFRLGMNQEASGLLSQTWGEMWGETLEKNINVWGMWDSVWGSLHGRLPHAKFVGLFSLWHSIWKRLWKTSLWQIFEKAS